jgi:hypothetical protein
MEIKKIILWSYERGTWQYDVLCLLIIAFIFLTPSSLFNKPTPKPPDPTVIERRDDRKTTSDKDPQATDKKKRESEKADGKLPVVDK